MPIARFDWDWGLPYLESGPESPMAQQFEEAIAEHLAGRPNGALWGWKHPHSYLLLPFLRERFPEMRFIHVVRDGRDIALSDNQQQARHYGALLQRPDEPGPVRSAAWWAWANLRAQDTGGSLGNDYLVMRLEDLCADPAASIQRVLEFSGGEDDGTLRSEITRPRSLGRWHGCDGALVRKIEGACGDALRRFGYVC